MLKLEKRPSGIYRIRGTHYGVPVRKSAGTRDRAEAEKVREAWEKKIFAEVHELLPKKEQRYTFADAAESWLKSGGDVTLYFYFERVYTALADIPLSDFTRGLISQKATALFPTQKDSTVNRGYFALVSVILTHAAEERMMTPIKVKPRKIKKTRLDWHSPETIEKLLASSDALHPLLTFMVGTGVRTSEALRLEWKDVSQDNSRVTFWNTKSGRTRSVDLCERTLAALPPRKEGRVFLREDGQPWSETADGRFYGFRQRLKRLCERKKLPHIKPHSLRHTWASWQYALKPDPLNLMGKGGWASLKMVENYAHVATPDLARRVSEYGWFQDEDAQNPPIKNALTA